MANIKKNKKIDWNRIAFDLQYIFLNKFVNQIPSWLCRKRIYEKMGMTIGKGARVGIGTVVVCPKGIKIGDRSVINESCMLDGRGGLRIGSDVSVSAYTKIITASHRLKDFKYFESATSLGDHVWTGTGAIILNGSRVASYTVIGAGAVLKKKTKKGEIYVGNPAKCIRQRGESVDYRLDYKAYFR